MGDWKELKKTTPIEVLIDDRYTIEYYDGTTWNDVAELDNSYSVAYGLSVGQKYRYRLKPLEPIVIDQNVLDIICDHYDYHPHGVDWDDTWLEDKLGRKFKMTKDDK